MEKNKIFTIIHIAEIKVSSFSGVSVVVPQHVNAQKKYANVAFVNVNNVARPGKPYKYICFLVIFFICHPSYLISIRFKIR